jgi:hypothetical protein
VRAGSTVTLSVFPVHITITQTRPHLRSALCRSTQFATSINNAVSQRGLRSASCIVDVDWLNVWVQLVVRGKDGDYRDGQLNGVFACCMYSNEPSNVGRLTALAGTGPNFYRPTPSFN